MSAGHSLGSVLLVDDQPESLRLLVELLQDRGYLVRPVPSGRLAIQAAQRSAPDLILLDILMPELDGFAVIHQLRQLEGLADIPVIFLSAYASNEDRVAAFRCGGVDYIAKPFQAEEVEARVATHLHLAQLRRDLEAANRELELFAQTAAHDLRSPLMRILDTLELLAGCPGSAAPETRQYLDWLFQAAQRMDKLIQDLLDFSSPARAELQSQPVDLDLLVCEVLAELQPAIRGRRIRWDLEPLPAVQGDPALLRLVVQNLLGNAVKFSSRTPEAVIQVLPLERDAGFLVRDNGVGFDPAKAGEVFRPFVRLHHRDDFAGTGLGLAQVQRIVARHGGRVWAEAEPGRGATFRVALPGVKGDGRDEQD